MEWGFWSRDEREHCHQPARGLGANVQTVFVDEPIETLHERVSKRNRDLPPGTFSISAEESDEWVASFEPPTHDELAEH